MTDPILNGLRGIILSVLAKGGSLSAKQVFELVSKEERKVYSYAAVHKALLALSSDEVIIRAGLFYSISPVWLNKLSKFASAASSRLVARPKLEVGVGSSANPDPKTAGKEAALAALKQCNANYPPQLCLLFCSSKYCIPKGELQAGVARILGNCPIAGCSTSGEFNGRMSHGTVLAIVFCANPDWFTAKIQSTSLTQAKTMSQARASADKLSFAGKNVSLGLLFLPSMSKKDGFANLPKEMVHELTKKAGFPIVGGQAGDEWHFESSYQFANSLQYEESVVFATITCKTKVKILGIHGYKPTGHALKPVFKQDGSLVSLKAGSSQGKTSAVKEYSRLMRVPVSTVKELLPQHIYEVVCQNKLMPLSSPPDYSLLRFPLKTNPDGSIQFTSPLEAGKAAFVMQANASQLKETFIKAINPTHNANKDTEFVLVFCCALIEAVTSRSESLWVKSVKTAGPCVMGEVNPGVSGKAKYCNGTIVAVKFEKN